MCTTRSGTLVHPTNLGVPTLEDIACSLGRLPRFAGHTSGWWSVLHHLHTGWLWIHSEDSSERLMLLWMLHDAEESIIGDIPSTWKTKQVRPAFAELFARIVRRHWIGAAPRDTEIDIVKMMDMASLVAEMQVLGPPKVIEHAGVPAQWLGELPWLDAVQETRARFPEPHSSAMELESPLVRWWIAEVTRLQEHLRNAEDHAAAGADEALEGLPLSMEELVRAFVGGDSRPDWGQPH